MNKIILLIVLLAAFQAGYSQIPSAVNVQILKAEDARRYDTVLERLMTNPDAAVSRRAILAAGRIGDEKAVESLSVLLESGGSDDMRSMAAFALGEIESMKAAEVILKILSDAKTPDAVRAKAVEAAGKIAAANAKDENSKALSKAIIAALEAEDAKGVKQNRETILLGLTAALRTRPAGGEVVIAKFLANPDARTRADAANTLSRLRAKNANEILRKMVTADADAVARANAARALGSAEDKEAFTILLKAAADDEDMRVRVSAVRSLAQLKDERSADMLLGRLAKPLSKNEMFEVVAAIGRVLEGKGTDRAIAVLTLLREMDNYRSPETEIAFARIAPEKYLTEKIDTTILYTDPWAASSYAQGMQVLADSKDEVLRLRAAQMITALTAKMGTDVKPADRPKMLMALPDFMRTIAAFKPDNLDEILRNLLTNEDVFIRATAAEIIGERPYSKENMEALNKASVYSVLRDKFYNDAQLAIMDASFKLNKKESLGTVLGGLNANDYLVRKKAFELLKDVDTNESPGVPTFVEHAKDKHKDQVLPYMSAFGTKLGQILNTEADYRRAAARKNGNVKAILTTAKGVFTIDLLPEDAPLTVDNFIKLARASYFNGLQVHRVVANFVMQDGDPRGDGNGGPGWSIRCEVNTVPFERGAVGMALSGKDTGGSQWFAAHSPQPHLDGGYTVFGKVNEEGMKIVDNVVRGDKIISVKIVEAGSQQRTQRTRRRK